MAMDGLVRLRWLRFKRNSSQRNRFRQGLHKNYIQLILPLGSKRFRKFRLIGREVDTIPILTDFLTYEGCVPSGSFEIEERKGLKQTRLFWVLIVFHRTA